MSKNSSTRESEKLLSIALKAIDKHDYIGAINNIQKAILKNQTNPKAWHLMSVACKKIGKIENAESFVLTSLGLDSSSHEAWVNLAEIYIDQGQLEKALNASEKACCVKPNHEDSLKVLANVYLNQKKYQESLRIFEKIHRQNPKNIFGNWGIAYSLYKLSRIQDSKPYIDNLLESGGLLKFVNLMNGYYLSEVEGQVTKSLELFQEELKLDPESPCANGVIGRTYASLGEVETAYEYEKKQLQVNKTANVYDNFLMHIHYNSKISNQEILDWAKEYQSTIYPQFNNLNFSKKNYPNIDWEPKKKILKIGFVSGDFRKHAIFSWLHGLMGMLACHDLEIFCYCNNKHDIATEVWKSEVSNWRDIKDLEDDECFEVIKKDYLDILVDLSGHTALNRLGIFARKPAPVQITWLGQSSPIGIQNIDYTISDNFLIKPEEDHFYLQKVYRMPNYFAIFQPPEKNVDIQPPPCETNDFVTFGCFNNFMKINSDVILTWIQILQKVPNSKLMLKAKIFKDELLKKNLLEKFARSGIEENRIILSLHDSNKYDYLAAYNNIDIALDPFPLGGGTTTHDLLWMSVPLIALYGTRMSARISAGILHNINSSELIAYTQQEYINKAVELANNIDQIKSYKKNLRNKYLSSPCCDKELFASQLNKAFRDIWENTSTDIKDE
jgi:predicted O-linked N-acetylglucosamine transferase (SPINDLY family)